MVGKRGQVASIWYHEKQGLAKAPAHPNALLHPPITGEEAPDQAAEPTQGSLGFSCSQVRVVLALGAFLLGWILWPAYLTLTMQCYQMGHVALTGSGMLHPVYPFCRKMCGEGPGMDFPQACAQD